jgi:kynureninase
VNFSATPEFALQLDREDPLAPFRKRFIIPPHGEGEQAYFLGNSLGLQPASAAKAVDRVLGQWAARGVESFFMGDDPWLDMHESLLGPLSTIMGCLPAELTVMNALTVNLHLMMVSFYRPQGRRRKILCEAKAFPSDQYMLATHVAHLGLDPEDVIVEVHPREGEHVIRTEDILQAIVRHGDELALVMWGGLNYYTGQAFDMQAITAAAHRAGALAGFDLAHAAGNLRLELHAWDVDFACWCNYKYLNGGPGAAGAAYIHTRYHDRPGMHRFAGWWGNERRSRFRMEKNFLPAASAEGWQLSTPSPLLYACLRASLEIFAEAGWENILEKKERLSSWLWFLLDELNRAQPAQVIECITPRQEKGCQVSLLMPAKGREVFDKLTAEGIITDWREPDVIRLAPVPLYNNYSEIWRFYATLRDILETVR